MGKRPRGADLPGSRGDTSASGACPSGNAADGEPDAVLRAENAAEAYDRQHTYPRAAPAQGDTFHVRLVGGKPPATGRRRIRQRIHRAHDCAGPEIRRRRQRLPRGAAHRPYPGRPRVYTAPGIPAGRAGEVGA